MYFRSSKLKKLCLRIFLQLLKGKACKLGTCQRATLQISPQLAHPNLRIDMELSHQLWASIKVKPKTENRQMDSWQLSTRLTLSPNWIPPHQEFKAKLLKFLICTRRWLVSLLRFGVLIEWWTKTYTLRCSVSDLSTICRIKRSSRLTSDEQARYLV